MLNFLSFGNDDREPNRWNRFLVADQRNHEGKPYFKGREKEESMRLLK